MTKRVLTQCYVVVGAIIERGGKVLLVQENMKGNDNGKWNQPAGWPDVGENPLTAVAREVKEETGLDFKPTHLVGIYSLVRSDLTEELKATPHATKLIFRGEFSGEVSFDRSEIRDAKWFSLEEIEKMTPTSLRDLDIKKEVADYFAGKAYPLEIIRYTVSEP